MAYSALLYDSRQILYGPQPIWARRSNEDNDKKLTALRCWQTACGLKRSLGDQSEFASYLDLLPSKIFNLPWFLSDKRLADTCKKHWSAIDCNLRRFFLIPGHWHVWICGVIFAQWSVHSAFDSIILPSQGDIVADGSPYNGAHSVLSRPRQLLANREEKRNLEWHARCQ